MDFDEYEYLEKTVENLEPEKSKGAANGGESVKSGERDHRSRSSRHRSDSHNDLDRRGSERHRDRGSSRHRSRSRDVERSERDRDRYRREHRDRDKESDERNGKDRERDRHKDKDGEKDKERDRDRGRDRRSRSHSEKRRDDRARSQDRERIERELRERDRESRRHKDKKEEEPEVDPERDQRTVFAYQIALRADERDVYEFFSRAGKVRDVRLIMDRNSRRSKGVGYIEFYDAMSVPMAIALSGQPLFGQPVMVKPSEAEKNLAQSTTSAAGTGGVTGPFAVGGRKLYVGNLHYNITEVQLRQVFEAFGTVELVQMPVDETGHCKGFGFVQFARLEDAKAALTLNGQLEIAGRTIKVSAVTDQIGLQDTGKTAGDLDDDEGGCLSLNAQSRALLMAKLDRSGTASSITSTGTGMSAPILGVSPLIAPFMQPPVAGLGGLAATAFATADPIGVPTECLLLKNMFDPAVEEGDFDLEIKEDVETECAKHGTLRHIFVDKESAGFVYLKFGDTKAAINAQRALHGRYFAGKMITANFMVPQTYEAKFPESR